MGEAAGEPGLQSGRQDFLLPLGPIPGIVSELIKLLQVARERQSVSPHKLLGLGSQLLAPLFCLPSHSPPPSPSGFLGGGERKSQEKGVLHKERQKI